MQTNHSKLRNLADWSEAEWHNLDIHLFIAANFNRYCSSLIKKIGLQYLPSDATECLLGLFCDVGYRPLSSVHQKNLDAMGERRNQIMLGTLKMIASTRMVDALIKEYPSYIALEQLPYQAEEGEYGSYTPLPLEDRSHANLAAHRTALFAAQTSDQCDEEIDQELSAEADRLSIMVETLRAYLTPVQYKHIRYAICDGLDSFEIAERTGHSVTNVRIMLLNARKKMLELVPSHLAPSVQECLHRK